MKKAQAILEYTIITAFLLLSALLIIRALNTQNVERGATFGIRGEDKQITVPPMTPSN